jgi:hypothetical protein
MHHHDSLQPSLKSFRTIWIPCLWSLNVNTPFSSIIKYYNTLSFAQWAALYRICAKRINMRFLKLINFLIILRSQ